MMTSNFFDPTIVKYEIEDEEIEVEAESEPETSEMITIKEEPPLEIVDYNYFSDSDSEYKPAQDDEIDMTSESSVTETEYDRLVDCVQCKKPYKWLGGDVKPTTKKPVSCRDCGEKFFNLFLLDEHYKNHEGDCKCYPCNILFDCAEDLVNHQLQSHYERFMCYLCAHDNVPTVEKLVRKAVAERSSSYVYGRCKICNQETDANFKMKKHFLEYHPGLELDFDMKCNDCDIFFGSRKTYRRHRDGVHRRRQKEYLHAICHVCDKILIGYDSNFKDHFKIKHPENEFSVKYKCPNCNEFFKTTADIIHHRITVHKGTFEVEAKDPTSEQMKYVFGKCNLCQKELSCRQSIERHFGKIHPGVELNAKYKCQQCDKFFNSEADVTKHGIVIHQKLKSDNHSKEETVMIKCDICRRFFTTKGTLRRHYRAYHPGIEFSKHRCQTCNKLFDSEADVTQHCSIKHQKTVVEERGTNRPKLDLKVKHKCQTCNKLFNSDAEVSQHFSIEHQEAEKRRPRTIFGKCNLCKKLLSTKFVLEKHFENKHPGEMFDVEYKCQKCVKFFKSREAVKRHSEIHLLRTKFRR